MICSFCGTDNRESNKFCGMCGVRLERRKADRRVHQDGSHLKCPACAYVNEAGYKFCGMCGTRIDRRVAERRGSSSAVQAGGESRSSVLVAVPNVTTAEPVVQRRSEASPVSKSTSGFRSMPPENFSSDRPERTGIQGPSFLGLSDEPDDDSSYLLEEENSSRSGLRRLVLLVILAAIAGLIFVQYRSSLRANPKPVQPSQPSQSAPVGPQGQTQPAQNPGTNGSGDQSQAPSPNTNSPDQGSQPAAQDPSSAPQGSDPAPKITPTKAETSALPQLDPTEVAEKSPAPEIADKAADNAAINALDAPVPSDQKPSPMLVRAQQFLHGEGVQQNCDQGLVYLRAAAQKNEPAAAVQMGALYASGHCVHQDRVMAYRWFNSAHELQPANQWIQRNMDVLWGQMTEQERRLAAY
jgi:Double zinc ribbon